MEKEILYFGRTVKVACDEKCSKAFGMIRPRIYDEFPNDVFGHGFTASMYPDDIQNPDNHTLLSDSEVGEAPIDNGCYEGEQGKPVNDKNEPLLGVMPNKWCIRQCERCVIAVVGKTIELKDFSKRVKN